MADVKKIAVVTGGNGFVGSHLVDFLLEKGYHVRCLVRTTSDLKWITDKGVEFINSGLFDTKGLHTALEGAAYLYHVAGVVKSKKPEGYFQANVEGTRSLLNAAKEHKDTLKKVLIVSSQTVGGPSRDGNPVNEEMPPAPITTYGRSKHEQENAAKTFMNDLPITICRAPAIYGERDTEVFIFFQTYAKGLFTTIGFEKKRLNLIHAVDLVRGFYEAALNEKTAGNIYYVASEELYTWEQIGDVTAKVFGKKAFHVAVPHFIVYTVAGIAQFFALFSSKAATLNIEKARDITQRDWICSVEKAKKDFGFRQTISIEDGMKRTVDWYKEQKWLR